MATPDASLAWPAGEKGNVLVDVVLDKPVDEAFLLIYGAENELRVRPRRRPRIGRHPLQHGASGHLQMQP